MTKLRKKFIYGYIALAMTAVCAVSPLSGTAQVAAKADSPQFPKISSTATPETLRLIEIIERKNRDLQKREAKLLVREENLKTLEKKIREDLQKIEAAMVRSEELAGAKKGMVEKNVTSLSKVYASMKPAQAAAILETVDEGIALQIISRMKSRAAGKILGKMKKSVAKSISERLAGKFASAKFAAKN